MDGSRHDAEGVDNLDDPVARVLAGCPTLAAGSPARDDLWIAVRDAVCTRRRRFVTADGARHSVEVTVEHATVELLAAMGWLIRHEGEARAMAPAELTRVLMRAATRGHRGSARAAHADALHGLTGVPAEALVRFVDLDARREP